MRAASSSITASTRQHHSQYAAGAGTVLHLVVLTVRVDHCAERHSSAADPQAPARTAYKVRVNVRRQAAGRLVFTSAGTTCHGPAPKSMVGLGLVACSGPARRPADLRWADWRSRQSAVFGGPRYCFVPGTARRF